MISLKQFWNSGDASQAAAPDIRREDIRIEKIEQREENKQANEWKPAWESLLFAVSDSAGRAIPSLGRSLSQKLSALRASAVSAPDEASLRTINEALRMELERWSDDAARCYGEHQQELKEIISAVARTAESVGNRDDRYTQELGVFAANLRTVADHTDLGVIRRSIVESAGAVQACVARMAKEGRETVRQLTAQTEEYRRRMEEAERISLMDPLTGLLNRRGLDRVLAERIAAGTPFFVTMLDLDRFKSINDSFGHAAGDDLLRQLSAELVSQFPPPRVIARLGGDEFLILASGNLSDAATVGVKMRSWVFGKYRVPDCQGRNIEVSIQGSLGSTSWNGREAAEALLARVDEMMYRTKATQTGTAPGEKVAQGQMSAAISS